MPGQDLTITAQWDVEQYTLTIKLNNGQEDIVLTQDYGSDIEAIADPVKEGYKFSGWDSQIPSKMPAGNRTVNATWSIKQYTLTIVYGNGQENLVITQDYDSYILTTIGTPTKEHATFIGWDKEIPSKMPAQDLTITALWEINQYSLIFVLDNGEEDVVITQDYDTDILATIVTPTREHATFLGWDKEIPSKMPGQNLTITALWEIKQYSLTFVLDNGEEDVVVTQEYGSDIGAIANPEKVGYKFVGWDKEIPSKMPGQNLTITALWEINQYTLTFVLNNGEDNLVITQNYNSDIDASAIEEPTKVGYIFKCWDKEIPTKMPAENLIITAQWEMNNAYYKVETYLQNIDNDEYTLDKSNSYTAYGLVDTMVEVKPLKMEHFTFNEEMSVLSGKVDADGKLVLVGYYTRQYYSLSNENSTIGTITNEGSYKYGSELTSSVSKDMLLGYEFIGWYAGKTLLSTESTYTFTISQDVTAKFDMLKEMTNYSFDSTFTSCVLNSVKDTSITSAIVPDCVTEVSGNLFNGCTNLKTLIIGNGVSQLPGGLLKGCSNLQSLTIPFVGASKNSTTASPSTLFGYIFGTSSFDGAEIAKQEYKYNFYEEYYVPTSLKTVVVTGGKVLHGAFQGCKNIENITLPNDLTTIENYVFKSCTNLTNVIIPENVTSIGSNAFYECKYLYNIDIPENVTFIGYGAFYQCTRLQTIVIPDKVTKIDGFAFYGCDSLVKVTVGKSVTEIGTSAFMFSNKIIEIYNKSNLVFKEDSYDYGAIASSVKNIYTPTSGTAKLSKDANGYLIYTDGEDKILVAYQGNSTILEIPSDITKIHNYAFKYGKEDFTIVKLPQGLKEIGIEAFLGCENLTYISVPDSVTTIDSRAFANCSGLETLIIGNGVNYLSLGLLEGCSNLKNLTIPFVGYEKYNDNKDTVLFGYIFGNKEFANTKAVKQYWAEDSFATFYIPTSLSTVTVTGGKLNYGAFYGCDMLTKITLQNVTSIGEQAFVGCSGLTSIVIPDSVESIGAKAFFYSKTLTNVTIGTGLKSVGEHAFDGCDNIVKVKYTGDINGWALIDFADWANPLSNTIAGLYIDDKLVTSATINSNSIGTNVFYNYKKLESVTIGSSVEKIGISAFACTNITSVVFEENSTCSLIADYAFWGCESLESIDLPSSLKTIGKNAFEWCTNLTSVDFGENSTCSQIDDCAFKDCVNLESMDLPSSLTFIGKNAFENCTALTSVTGTQNWYLVQYINDTVSKINFSNLAPEVFAQHLTGEYKDYYWKC